MQIDITVFLVEALASNNNIKKDIEEIYQKNKYKAYKLAKDSEYYSHPIITSGSLEWEMRCKKALGIVLLDLIEEQDNTLTLIQKGWRSLYKHLESKKNETLNVEKILTTYVSPKQTDNEIFAVVTMIVVLQNMFKYEIEDKENLKVFQDRVLFTMNKHSEIKKVDFDTYSEKYICIETRKKLFRFNSINFSEYSHMMNQFNKKAINSLEFIEDLEELYIDNLLEDIKLTKKDIDELIMTYRLSEEYDLNSQRDLEKLLNYLLYAMQIRFLLKAYKKVKKQFFENNSETMYVELEHLENQVKDLQQKLEQQQKQIAYLNYENTKLKKEYKEGLEKQISKLERENIKLCTQLEEGLKNKVELEKLRNFLFPEKVEVKDDLIYK